MRLKNCLLRWKMNVVWLTNLMANTSSKLKEKSCPHFVIWCQKSVSPSVFSKCMRKNVASKWLWNGYAFWLAERGRFIVLVKTYSTFTKCSCSLNRNSLPYSTSLQRSEVPSLSKVKSRFGAKLWGWKILWYNLFTASGSCCTRTSSTTRALCSMTVTT